MSKTKLNNSKPINRYKLKANLKRYVLRQHLKVKFESVLHRLVGSAFHSVGAATLKDLSPKVFFIFPAGCNRVMLELEHSE